MFQAGENFFLYVTVSDGQLTAKSEVYVNIVSQNDTKINRNRRPPGPKIHFGVLPPGFPQRPPPPIYQRPSDQRTQLDKIPKLTPQLTSTSTTTVAPSTTPPVPKVSKETVSETVVTSTSKSVFKVPHIKTTEKPKTINYGGSDKTPTATSSPSVFSILVTVLPVVIFTTVFLVFSILICLFRKKIFKKKHLSKKDANLVSYVILLFPL